MTTTMSALNSPSIRHAEFVKLNVSGTNYYFCNAAGPITVSGMTFDAFGSFLQLSTIQQDIKSTSADLTVGLSGLDPDNIALMLSSDIKGSIIEVWRGFINSSNQIITTPTTQFFKRYQGVVNSISISEEFNNELRSRLATCNMNCSSYRQILQNRIAGVRTNPSNWKAIHPNDVSMDRVPKIVATYFDFGKAPKRGSVSTDTTITSSVDESGGS
jgi:hypothetical protein